MTSLRVPASHNLSGCHHTRFGHVTSSGNSFSIDHSLPPSDHCRREGVSQISPTMLEALCSQKPVPHKASSVEASHLGQLVLPLAPRECGASTSSDPSHQPEYMHLSTSLHNVTLRWEPLTDRLRRKGVRLRAQVFTPAVLGSESNLKQECGIATRFEFFNYGCHYRQQHTFEYNH